jgi:hypothetical protein
VFRWIGPDPEAEITVKVPRHVPVACMLSVINTVQPDVFKSIEIEVDGMSADINLGMPDNQVGPVRFVMPPRHGDPNVKTRFTIKLRETISPVAVNPSAMDMRRLGIAVRNLVLRPA